MTWRARLPVRPPVAVEIRLSGPGFVLPGFESTPVTRDDLTSRIDEVADKFGESQEVTLVIPAPEVPQEQPCHVSVDVVCF